MKKLSLIFILLSNGLYAANQGKTLSLFNVPKTTAADRVCQFITWSASNLSFLTADNLGFYGFVISGLASLKMRDITQAKIQAERERIRIFEQQEKEAQRKELDRKRLAAEKIEEAARQAAREKRNKKIEDEEEASFPARRAKVLEQLEIKRRFEEITREREERERAIREREERERAIREREEILRQIREEDERETARYIRRLEREEREEQQRQQNH